MNDDYLSEAESLGVGAAILLGLIFSVLIAGIAFAVGFTYGGRTGVQDELIVSETELTEHIAYSMGVHEGKRLCK